MTATENRKRWLALYVLCAGTLMIVLDATIVNVALPSIQDDLGFSQANLAWVVNAYLISFGGLLLLAGRFGDLFGQRRVFVWGLGAFTFFSLLCAAAEEVAHAAGQEQQPAERDQVGVHDPRQAGLGEPEVGLDGRKSDVHDGPVEDDHQHPHAEHVKRDPA